MGVKITIDNPVTITRSSQSLAIVLPSSQSQHLSSPILDKKYGLIQPMDTGRRGRKYYVSNVKQSTPFVYSKAGRAIPLFSTSATRKPKQSLEPRQSLVEQGKMWHTPHLLRIYDRLKRTRKSVPYNPSQAPVLTIKDRVAVRDIEREETHEEDGQFIKQERKGRTRVRHGRRERKKEAEIDNDIQSNRRIVLMKGQYVKLTDDVTDKQMQRQEALTLATDRSTGNKAKLKLLTQHHDILEEISFPLSQQTSIKGPPSPRVEYRKGGLGLPHIRAKGEWCRYRSPEHINRGRTLVHGQFGVLIGKLTTQRNDFSDNRSLSVKGIVHKTQSQQEVAMQVRIPILPIELSLGGTQGNAGTSASDSTNQNTAITGKKYMQMILSMEDKGNSGEGNKQNSKSSSKKAELHIPTIKQTSGVNSEEAQSGTYGDSSVLFPQLPTDT